MCACVCVCVCVCDLFSREENVAVVEYCVLEPAKRDVCGVFFRETVARMCDGDVSKDDLVSAFVSQRKEQVHPVDDYLPMADVIRVFGPLVKFALSGRPDAIPGILFTLPKDVLGMPLKFSAKASFLVCCNRLSHQRRTRCEIVNRSCSTIS